MRDRARAGGDAGISEARPPRPMNWRAVAPDGPPLLHHPERFERVPTHLEHPLLADHPENIRLLLPFRGSIDSKELVERAIDDLRVLREHLRVVLEQRNGAVVLTHVGHDP